MPEEKKITAKTSLLLNPAPRRNIGYVEIRHPSIQNPGTRRR